MAPTKSPTEQRIVKDAMFTYHESIPNPHDPKGDEVLIERTAYHGQTIDLLPHDIERGEKHDSFFKDQEPQAGEGAKYASQFDHTALVVWLRDQQPSTQYITTLVNEDPDPKQAAEKMLEAEREATQNDPRQDLVIGLEAIIEGSASEERTNEDEE
jgi:hypothetical protein